MDMGHLYDDSFFGSLTTALDVKERLQTQEINAREERTFEQWVKIFQRGKDICKRKTAWEKWQAQRSLYTIWERTPRLEKSLAAEKARVASLEKSILEWAKPETKNRLRLWNHQADKLNTSSQVDISVKTGPRGDNQATRDQHKHKTQLKEKDWPLNTDLRLQRCVHRQADFVRRSQHVVRSLARLNWRQQKRRRKHEQFREELFRLSQPVIVKARVVLKGHPQMDANQYLDELENYLLKFENGSTSGNQNDTLYVDEPQKGAYDDSLVSGNLVKNGYSGNAYVVLPPLLTASNGDAGGDITDKTKGQGASNSNRNITKSDLNDKFGVVSPPFLATLNEDTAKDINKITNNCDENNIGRNTEDTADRSLRNSRTEPRILIQQPIEATAAHGLQKTAAHGLQKTAAHGLQKTAAHGLQKTAAHGLQDSSIHGLQKTAAHGLQKVAFIPRTLKYTSRRLILPPLKTSHTAPHGRVVTKQGVNNSTIFNNDPKETSSTCYENSTSNRNNKHHKSSSITPTSDKRSNTSSSSITCRSNKRSDTSNESAPCFNDDNYNNLTSIIKSDNLNNGSIKYKGDITSDSRASTSLISNNSEVYTTTKSSVPSGNIISGDSRAQTNETGDNTNSRTINNRRVLDIYNSNNRRVLDICNSNDTAKVHNNINANSRSKNSNTSLNIKVNSVTAANSKTNNVHSNSGMKPVSLASSNNVSNNNDMIPVSLASTNNVSNNIGIISASLASSNNVDNNKNPKHATDNSKTSSVMNNNNAPSLLNKSDISKIQGCKSTDNNSKDSSTNEIVYSNSNNTYNNTTIKHEYSNKSAPTNRYINTNNIKSISPNNAVTTTTRGDMGKCINNTHSDNNKIAIFCENDENEAGSICNTGTTPNIEVVVIKNTDNEAASSSKVLSARKCSNFFSPSGSVSQVIPEEDE